jgi:flavin-dependent thymidylate synthase
MEIRMNVILAGYNLDSKTLAEAREYLSRCLAEMDPKSALYKDVKAYLDADHFTPETLSAAYARISRNPAPIPELRDIARLEVDKARKSNQNIIFGLGHSSVAEHAVFNFDILGVSRRVVEDIQHFRLTSHTEKSQRYIKLDDDFVIPGEIAGSAHEKAFVETIRLQNKTYHELYGKLRPFVFDSHPELAAEKRNHRLLEGWAKEDARYVVALATEAQLGMTVNARVFEHMLAKLASSPLQEARDFAKQAYEATHGLAPSIVKYTEPTEFFRDLPGMISGFRRNLPELSVEKNDLNEVIMLNYTAGAQNKVLAALLAQYEGIGMVEADGIVEKLDDAQKKELMALVTSKMATYDAVPRAFERVSAEFQMIVSAGCYGQLKRHRMATQLPARYDINLGNTIPPSISDIGEEQSLLDVIAETNTVYRQIAGDAPLAAEYILTNSHRRKVFFKANLREYYHFSRLREDAHSQWDIRNIARKVGEILRYNWPLIGGFLGGKDALKDTMEY